jgi:hypothetical protein
MPLVGFFSRSLAPGLLLAPVLPLILRCVVRLRDLRLGGFWPASFGLGAGGWADCGEVDARACMASDGWARGSPVVVRWSWGRSNCEGETLPPRLASWLDVDVVTESDDVAVVAP